MTNQTVSEPPTKNSTERPYPPSWVDRFTAWVDRLPISPWLFYFGLWLILFVIETAIQWYEGAYPVGTFYPFYIPFTGYFAMYVAVIHYLDRVAARALDEFRLALNAEPETVERLRYELTTLPYGLLLVTGPIGAVVWWILGVFLISPGGGFESYLIALSSVSQAFNMLLSIFSWVGFGTFLYHTFHQLRVVNRILTRYTLINVFRPGPLYAFSDLSARTAIAVIIAVFSWYITVPGALTHLIDVVQITLYVILAALTFFWPLMGIHRLLASEKTRLLDQSGQQLEMALAELHRRIQQNEMTGMDSLNNAINALKSEREYLVSVPTWPWQPETLRALIAAVSLPAVAWLVNWFLMRLLE